MHKLRVLIIGPKVFVATIVELKLFLKFNLYTDIPNTQNQIKNYDILIFHSNVLEENDKKNFVENNNIIKIIATNKKNERDDYDGLLLLPATIKEINFIVENTAAKKIFNKNSSVLIKQFILNKNEKKLTKDNNFIILTEKEIKLLELFLVSKEPISKDKILSKVWEYSSILIR